MVYDFSGSEGGVVPQTEDGQSKLPQSPSEQAIAEQMVSDQEHAEPMPQEILADWVSVDDSLRMQFSFTILC